MSFTGKEKMFCVLVFDKNSSWTCVQRKFWTEFSKQPPDQHTIQKWHAKFKEEGCLCSQKRIAPLLSTETIKRVRNIFQWSPRKSIRRASRELEMSSTTIWQVVKKHLHMIPYKLHLLQHLKDTNKPTFVPKCRRCWKKTDLMTDKATFHLTDKVNKHNTFIWETEHPHSTLEHVRDSPKVNVFYAISKKRVYEPFFFQGTTVNSEVYLDMLQNWLIKLLFDGEQADFIFQQNGVPLHWSLIVRQYLKANLCIADGSDVPEMMIACSCIGSLDLQT